MYAQSGLDRPEITEQELDIAIGHLKRRLKSLIAEHGAGAHASLHEINGDLREELREFEDEVHANHLHLAGSELLDVAVAAVWGYAGIVFGQVKV